MKSGIMWACVLSLCIGVYGSVSAQEEEYAYGVVLSASQEQLVVREYNEDTGKEEDATYIVSPETEVQNSASVAALVADDPVEVYFENKDGKKVALFVIKDELVDDESLDTAFDDDIDMMEEDEEPLPDLTEAVPTQDAPQSAPLTS